VTDVFSRMLNIRREELPLAILSALLFFFVLCGYYFLRPVRDAMGVSRGMDEFRWLFVVTSLTSLVVVLAFGGVVGSTNRRRFIPFAYLFVIVCLLGFAGLLIWDAMSGGGFIGTEAQTTLSRVVGYTFFVWLSVINLFITAVFWAFMVDLFNVDQGKRMFAFIGIGGTVGALVGASVTTWISGKTHSIYLPAGLMLTGAAFFAFAIVTVLMLDRMALSSAASRLAGSSTGGPMTSRAQATAAIGGRFWDGAKAVATSPYLLGIALWIVFMAISNTLIYFSQAHIVLAETDTFSRRVQSFGGFDMAAQVATLLTQMFITTHLIKKLGVGWTLCILPLVTMAGFAALSVWTIYGVMAVFQAVQRATRYAVSRPARETLYSVITPAEKYKAKPIVDVFLYRGGDVTGAGIDAGFGALGLGLGWIAAATVPLAAVWSALSLGLGRAQQRKDAERLDADTVQASPTPSPQPS
jgi:AAA family ATP:ADP antiporter